MLARFVFASLLAVLSSVRWTSWRRGLAPGVGGTCGGIFSVHHHATVPPLALLEATPMLEVGAQVITVSLTRGSAIHLK